MRQVISVNGLFKNNSLLVIYHILAYLDVSTCFKFHKYPYLHHMMMTRKEFKGHTCTYDKKFYKLQILN